MASNLMKKSVKMCGVVKTAIEHLRPHLVAEFMKNGVKRKTLKLGILNRHHVKKKQLVIVVEIQVTTLLNAMPHDTLKVIF